MEIRKACAEEISTLVDLIERIEGERKKAEKRASRINSKGKLILVIEDQTELIGYVGISKYDENKKARDYVDTSKFACLMWVGVEPDYRNRGLGSRLLIASEALAINWKKKGLWLECGEKRLLFYQGNGYQEMGHYDKLGKTKYVMAKEF